MLYCQLIILFFPLLTSADVPCGTPVFPVKHNKISNRIVGGWEANPHSVPWQVYLKNMKTSTTFGACGASLIQFHPGNGTDLVLTASHCIHDQKRGAYSPATNLIVTAGAHDRRNRDEPTQVEAKVRAYRSDLYKPDSLTNDIALLKLDRYIVYNDYIRPVCLPEQDQELPKGDCFVSGWGALVEDGTSPNTLQMVDVNIVSKDECYLRPNQLAERFCAGFVEGGKDSCQGDSGGPMVCNVNGKYVQFGVVSYGEGCARVRRPGIYTRVAHYINWMKEQDASLRKTYPSVMAPSTDQITRPTGSAARPPLTSSYSFDESQLSRPTSSFGSRPPLSSSSSFSSGFPSSSFSSGFPSSSFSSGFPSSSVSGMSLNKPGTYTYTYSSSSRR